MTRPGRLLVAALFAIIATAPSWANWTASGTVKYRDREFDQTGFTGVEPVVNARFVDVEIVDATTSAVIGSGATNASGAFSFTVTDSSTRNIYARALTRSTKTTTLFVRVTNYSAVVYSIVTATTNGHTQNTNVNFGTMTAGIGAGGEAFNLFDQSVYGADYIAFLTGSRPGSASLYTVRWAINQGNGGSTTSGFTTDMRDSGG